MEKVDTFLTRRSIAEVLSCELVTVNGETLQVSIGQAGAVQILNNDGSIAATVVQADVMASNGVIHVIDTVLIPETSA